MGASVTIQAAAFSDLRFEVLAKACGLADADHARGRVARLWSYCTDRNRCDLSPVEISAVLGSSGVAGLLESDLGRQNDDGTIYISGTEERCGWLQGLRDRAQVGGKARARTARRQPNGRFHSSQVGGAKPADTPATLVPAQPAKASPSVTTTTSLDPPYKPPAGAGAAGAAAVTREVVGAFNRAFNRRLDPKGWELSVKRLLSKGFTEKQLLGVVWWAAEEWGSDPEWRMRVSPKTLFKLTSSAGCRTFAEYLSLAGERWRQDPSAGVPPWELPQLALVPGSGA